jgi:hypothetical protein
MVHERADILAVGGWRGGRQSHRMRASDGGLARVYRRSDHQRSAHQRAGGHWVLGSLIKKRRKRMRKKKHKKMLKRTRWQRRAAGK